MPGRQRQEWKGGISSSYSLSGSDDLEVKSGVKHIYSDVSGSAEAIISFVGLDL